MFNEEKFKNLLKNAYKLGYNDCRLKKPLIITKEQLDRWVKEYIRLNNVKGYQEYKKLKRIGDKKNKK